MKTIAITHLKDRFSVPSWWLEGRPTGTDAVTVYDKVRRKGLLFERGSTHTGRHEFWLIDDGVVVPCSPAVALSRDVDLLGMVRSVAPGEKMEMVVLPDPLPSVNNWNVRFPAP